MKAGAYKICITDVEHGSTAVWKESGVVLILQKQVSSISVNGIIEVVATIPQRLGDHSPLKFALRFCLDSFATRCLFAERECTCNISIVLVHLPLD
jgi:hypothetical protein